MVSDYLTIPNADGDLLHYSAVASAPLGATSKVPAANDALIPYDQKTGKIFFIQNAADSGLGTDGLMAVVVGKPDLSIGDAFII